MSIFWVRVFLGVIYLCVLVRIFGELFKMSVFGFILDLCVRVFEGRIFEFVFVIIFRGGF